MSKITLNQLDFEKMEPLKLVSFFTSLSGIKSANLIGTVSQTNKTNLALFSSVIHLGSKPPLFGMVSRPNTVTRHTLNNILETRQYSINCVNKTIEAKAHQTAAKYPADVSEFSACNLTPMFTKNLRAPYVNESLISIGLEYSESIPIKQNGTIFVIGEVIEVIIQEEILETDGIINHALAETLGVTGLDCYHTINNGVQYKYPTPENEPKVKHSAKK